MGRALGGIGGHVHPSHNLLQALAQFFIGPAQLFVVRS